MQSASLRLLQLIFISIHVSIPAVLGDKASFTVALQKDDIEATLKAVPDAAYVLVEFFAPWCPHCQKFKPAYERVAAQFNTEPHTQPQIVVANVDCVAQSELCKWFSIRAYPTMHFGKAKEFLDVVDRTKDKEATNERTYEGQNTLNTVNAQHKTEAVIEWINKELNTNFKESADITYGNTYNSLGPATVPAPAVEMPQALNLTIPDVEPHKVDKLDIEKATTLSISYMFAAGQLTAQNRAPFMHWVALLASSHPIPRCRAGAQMLMKMKDGVWPAGSDPAPRLSSWRICGKGIEDRDWRSCKGSVEGMRGYSCGLWMLLHGLAANLVETESDSSKVGRQWMTGVRTFIKVFFSCEVCRAHFLEMASRDAAMAVVSKRDAVMWAWRAHNEVNIRLAAEEAEQGTGDPKFPKQYWPPHAQCPLCRREGEADVSSPSDEPDWNTESVYAYSLYYFGTGPRPFAVMADYPILEPSLWEAPGSVEEEAGYLRGDGEIVKVAARPGTPVHVMLVIVSGIGAAVCIVYWWSTTRTTRKVMQRLL